MISKIILHNFQSHAHSEISFSEGITSIIGESDHGKTAILRAFQWVWKNRPTGVDFVSHWATEADNAGNLILTDTCYVIVVFKDNKYVTRERGGVFNGYKIGSVVKEEYIENQVFGKIGTGVPFAVSDLFNMEDVNIQNQHDSMFLLSETGQDVARFFNKLIKLDKGDTALSLSESRKRGFKKLVTETELEIEETQEFLDKLDWVEPAEMMVEKINFTDGKIEKLSDDTYDLDQIIDNIISAAAQCEFPEYHEKAEMLVAKIDGSTIKIDSLDDKIYNITVLEHDIHELTIKVRDSGWIKDAQIFSKRVDDMNQEISKKTSSLIILDEMIESIEKCESNVEAAAYSNEAQDVIANIDFLDGKIISKMDKIDEIDLFISKIETLEEKISLKEKSIVLIKKQMPKVCPACGSKLKEVI